MRLEFGHVAGLGQVGVRAEVESSDAVVDRAERADDDDGGRDAGGPGIADDVASVLVRKHEVDEGQIVRIPHEKRGSVSAALGGGAGIAQLGQSFVEELPFRVVVFDYQCSHAAIIA